MLTTSLLRILLTRSLKPFVFEGNHDRFLDYHNLENLGLYVHIPFCRTLCSFCPYCKEHYNPIVAKSYLQALLNEIDLVGQLKAETNSIINRKRVTSLYFGGGTPALMIDDLSMIIQHLKKYFEITDGIGVELHPDDINPENINKLKAAGITMVSVGIQSFDSLCLSRLGRKNDQFSRKIQMLNESGFAAIDIDLIFGIPGQTAISLRQDVLTAFANGATQVSAYPFIDFTFTDNRYKPVSNHRKKELLKLLNNLYIELELERTSVWTFARKGTPKYSSVTRDNFLGFGVSATTLLHDQFKINTFSIDAYINRLASQTLPTSLTLAFSLRQRAVYDLFWEAYSLKIRPNRFQINIGRKIEDMFKFEIWLARIFGLLQKSMMDNNYRLTERAARIYHQLEQKYTHAYIDRMWHVSREVAFPPQIVLK